jgi:aminoglycoside phosphotransferase (APT) family kinase protein
MTEIAELAAEKPGADVTSLLLRAIAHELAVRIIPELKSADAIERATFARLLVLNLASDNDVLPGVAATLMPPLRKALAEIVTRAAHQTDTTVRAFAAELQQLGRGALPGTQQELLLLRALAARVVRYLADHNAAGTFSADIAQLGACDARWLNEYAAACKASAAAGTNAATIGPGATVAPATATAATSTTAPAELSAELITQYLRQHFPRSPALTATDLVSIPGGRSKKTFFFTVSGTTELPSQLVMRQDYALKYAGTKVADEYRPLTALAALGLAVPRPLHLEAAPTVLGPPFLLVDRLSGKPPGSYFAISQHCPGAFRDLATMLAKLHQMDLATLTAAPPAAQSDHIAALLYQYQCKWRDNTRQPSPVVDYAYAWAQRECQRDPGSSAYVHGDAGPYNMLVENDRLTALLDWEFAHLGDPAEDLGIARCYAEDFMDWSEFMSVYLAAGGQPVPESRIRLGMLLQFLKGTTLVAASGRNFIEGGTTEFIKGANAFTGQRMIELRIVNLLQRFGAV